MSWGKDSLPLNGVTGGLPGDFGDIADLEIRT